MLLRLYGSTQDFFAWRLMHVDILVWSRKWGSAASTTPTNSWDPEEMHEFIKKI